MARDAEQGGGLTVSRPGNRVAGHARPRLAAWALKRLAFHGGLLALARRAWRRQRGIVLRYHAVTAGSGVDYAAPSICMPVEALRLQVAFVRRAYRIVPLGTLVDALERGGTLDPGTMVITFDDGYADNHALALPVLRRFDVPATVYVATAGIDDAAPFWVAAVRVLAMRAPSPLRIPGMAPVAVTDRDSRERAATLVTRALVPLAANERAARLLEAAATAGIDLAQALAGTMLTTPQIRELHAAGWTIGAHTETHGNVALMAPADAEREIAGSRDRLRAIVGGPIEHFCYPNTGGTHRYFSPVASEILTRLGFRSATTSVPGAIRPGVDRWTLPRLGVTPRLARLPDLATAVERHRLAA